VATRFGQPRSSRTPKPGADPQGKCFSIAAVYHRFVRRRPEYENGWDTRCDTLITQVTLPDRIGWSRSACELPTERSVSRYYRARFFLSISLLRFQSTGSESKDSVANSNSCDVPGALTGRSIYRHAALLAAANRPWQSSRPLPKPDRG